MKTKISIFVTIFSLLFIVSAQSQSMVNTKHYTSHFLYQSSVSFNAGVGDFKFDGRTIKNKLMNFGIDQVIAYQFNPYVNLGVDLGLNFSKKSVFIPVCAHITVNFIDKFISPIFYANGGYSFKWYTSPKPEKMTHVIYGGKSGWYANAGIGARLALNDKVSLIFAADYKMQYSTLQYWHTDDPTAHDYSQITTNRSINKCYHSVGVKIGVSYW